MIVDTKNNREDFLRPVEDSVPEETCKDQKILEIYYFLIWSPESGNCKECYLR